MSKKAYFVPATNRYFFDKYSAEAHCTQWIAESFPHSDYSDEHLKNLHDPNPIQIEIRETIGPFKNEYRWLSNFWPAKVSLDGVEYSSTEHAYQAAKTNDPEIREQIRSLRAGEAKKLAQTIDLRSDWEEVKVDIMYQLNLQKYQEPAMKQKLLATEDAELVEFNTWGDHFYGVCNGIGQNRLGKILMRVREELKR